MTSSFREKVSFVFHSTKGLQRIIEKKVFFHLTNLQRMPLEKCVFFADVISQLVRQSYSVQSVMQDYQYDLSYLLPACNLLVQDPKITFNYCLSRRSGLLWCFMLKFVHFKFINMLN